MRRYIISDLNWRWFRYTLALSERNEICNCSFLFYGFTKSLTSAVRCIHKFSVEFEGVLSQCILKPILGVKMSL